jgi:hypothetical protein
MDKRGGGSSRRNETPQPIIASGHTSRRDFAYQQVCHASRFDFMDKDVCRTARTHFMNQRHGESLLPQIWRAMLTDSRQLIRYLLDMAFRSLQAQV